MSSGPGVRYAIYFAPHPDGRLWHFGSRILGYDAYRIIEVDQPALDGLSPTETRAATEAPRRYGFHATLKAPFTLAEGHTGEDLVAACQSFARRRAPVLLSGLRVRTIGSFLALVPAEHSPALDVLAAEVVGAFEPFRAALSDEERDGRLASGLTRRQRRYLETWGYPYVLEEFQFHMTLTGPLETRVRRAVHTALDEAYAEAVGNEPVEVDALSLFMQDQRNGRFAVVGRFPLAS